MNVGLEQALIDAAARPYDGGRVHAFSDLARRADADGQDEAAFNARLGLLDAAVMTNRFEVALATCPPRRADADAEPGRFQLEEQLLLAFPMVLGGATGFPDVPRKRLEELGEDFSRRSAAAGRHDSEIAAGLYRLATAMGDLPKAATLLQRMTSPWGGHFEECPHCRLRHETMLPWCAEDHPAVLKLVRRLIDGDLRCTRFEFCGPRDALLLRSLVLSDQWDEAVDRYRIAAGAIQSGPFWVMMPGLHLSFLAHVIHRGGVPGLSADAAAADLAGLLQRCLRNLEGVTPDNRMELFTAAAPSLAALRLAGAVPRLALPIDDPLAPLAG
ncbi:MAG: hypothetical protein AAF907_14170, partial [Planctomycetota bacterium]